MKNKYKISILDIKNELQKIEPEILDAHPILKYRINQIINGNDVRGLKPTDSHMCNLMLDDSVIAGKYMYNCVIHMREGGKPIGEVGTNMRKERYDFIQTFDTHNDPICKKSCLDVCVEYNNKYNLLNGL